MSEMILSMDGLSHMYALKDFHRDENAIPLNYRIRKSFDYYVLMQSLFFRSLRYNVTQKKIFIKVNLSLKGLWSSY
jgi:hypothetical protein